MPPCYSSGNKPPLMLFNSLEFLIFFPSVVALFFLLPHRLRILLLVVASYAFYATWNAQYCLLLAATTLIAYVAGIAIGSAKTPSIKLAILCGSLFAELCLLIYFKYFGFLASLVRPIVEATGIHFESTVLHILLPVGISFYIFQALAYLVDTYRGSVKPERDLLVFALFQGFFPQLLAGPIERAAHMLPQFHKHIVPDPARFTRGLRLLLWGAFKKIAIADNFASIVWATYHAPESMGGLALLLGTVCFAIQLYADFSGYTDMARGLASILGYDLVSNFDRPYFSRSIADFWRRWHISLTSWFQHYVFVPLYMTVSRSVALRQAPERFRHAIAFTIATVLGLSLLGLWHGANMTYLVFGLTQAAGLLFYHLTKRWWDTLPYLVANLGTLLIVLSGLVFFRAENLKDALVIFARIGSDILVVIQKPMEIGEQIAFALQQAKMSPGEFLSFLLLAALMFTAEQAFASPKWIGITSRLPRWVRWSAYYAILLLMIRVGDFGETAFIYFQF